MKKTICLLLLLVITAGCYQKSMNERMNEIDSLVVHEQYDSAYACVLRINSSELTEREDSAYYYLLVSQANILTHHPDSQIMLDSLVIPYYNNIGNHEKLAEAYYYKAFRILNKRDFPEAIQWFKKAEEQAYLTNNLRLHYKIYENLSYINGAIGNYTLQLDYAQKALKIAKAASNKEWIAYAYCRTSFAYSKLQNKDSAVMNMNQAMPYSRYIKVDDQPSFLTNAAYVYKYTMPDKAKKYLMESLAKKESSVTMQHLADIFYREGDEEKAYSLLKKALTVNDGVPKDNILHNILDYDMNHGHTDHVCETVNEILHIKDSMLNSLRNDTIKDLQLRFDHEVAMRRQEKVMDNWQKSVLFAVILIVLLASYIVVRRALEKIKMQDTQMEINDLISHIRELEANGEDAHDTIDSLNSEIKKLTEEESPKLKKGRMLYDQIIEDKPIKDWTIKEKRLFINYYMAINYRTVSRLKKVKRREPLTVHNLLYLLLMEMKDQNEDKVAKILSISENGMRTLKSRTKPEI